MAESHPVSASQPARDVIQPGSDHGMLSEASLDRSVQK